MPIDKKPNSKGIDIYTMEGCQYCHDIMKALEKPGFKERYALYKVIEEDNKFFKINLKSKKKAAMDFNIKAFPLVVVNGVELRGEEGIDYVRDGALNMKKTLEKECPYRKFKKCRGPSCSKWVSSTAAGGVPVIYCADVLQVELQMSISRKLNLMQLASAESKTAINKLMTTMDKLVSRFDRFLDKQGSLKEEENAK